MINCKFSRLNVFMLLMVVSVALLSGCAPSVEDVLKESAKTAQRNCPQVLDQYTSMTKAEYIHPRTLKYTYLVKKDFSEEEKTLLEGQLRNVSIAILKKQAEFPFYVENDVSFEYVYLNKENQVVAQVSMKPSDYK